MYQLEHKIKSRRKKATSTLKGLIEFIEPSGDKENPWNASKWERELTKSIPDWKPIVRDESSWDELDKVGI